MSYISFDKPQLINLEYSLDKELLRSNRAGSFASTTIVGCNTRKYHGLLFVPVPQLDDGVHLLLSSLDETVIQREAEFNLGIRKYPGSYNPKGHKYIRDFNTEPIPTITYRVGGVVLKKEMVFAHHADRILIRYTLVDAHSPTLLRFKPFLGFRNRHTLSKENTDVIRKYEPSEGGIRVKMYNGYPYLYLQFNKAPEYTHVPDWYKDVEYEQEARRGYEFHEDLYVPGFFELPIKKGESIIFSAGTEEVNPENLKKIFRQELNKRTPRDSFEHCLQNAAQQFYYKRDSRTELVAGYPWNESTSRFAFMSLPGLTQGTGNEKLFRGIVDNWLSVMDGPLIPGSKKRNEFLYDNVDSPLWFIWALQKYAYATHSMHKIWSLYGSKIKAILNGYYDGTRNRIGVSEDGLLYAGDKSTALTWMDGEVEGLPVVPRYAYVVEVNALWYNAIRFALKASSGKDRVFEEKWEPIAEKLPAAFVSKFWSQEKGYLADFVTLDGEQDWSVRPNQVIAASMPNTLLDERKRKSILDTMRRELLTPRGLRTLSPKDPDYESSCFGSQSERDRAAYNGSTWPWLFGHFAEAYLKIHGASGLSFIKMMLADYEDDMRSYGIGSIAELYDGNPPHNPGGAISFAPSTAELLRVIQLIKEYEDEDDK